MEWNWDAPDLGSVGKAIGDWSHNLSPGQATLLAAVTVVTVGGLSLWQKARTDKRDQWWKRTQWATDLAFDVEGSDERQVAGFAALGHLVEDATKRDKLLLVRIVDTYLGDADETDDLDIQEVSKAIDNESRGDDDVSPSEGGPHVR